MARAATPRRTPGRCGPAPLQFSKYRPVTPSTNGERRPRMRRRLLPAHRAGGCEGLVPGPEYREETLTLDGAARWSKSRSPSASS